MANPAATEVKAGMFVSGKVLSCTAILFQKKDGSGKLVKITIEISTRPGVVYYEQIMDPGKDVAVKVEGEKVIAFPSVPEDSWINLKVDPAGINEFRGKLRVTRAERIA